jgi:hypothetical protein
MKQCAECGNEYESKTAWQRFCSAACKGTFNYKKGYTPRQYPHLTNSGVGAVNELRVSQDLMIRGYEVFRALAADASCDLIALKDGKTLRIQVRTARVVKNHAVCPVDGVHDVLVKVCPDTLLYFPALEELC